MYVIAMALLFGQIATQEKAHSNLQQGRYMSFLRAAELYEMRIENDDDKRLVIIDKPVLRWGNQARDNDDGAVFIWTYRGRPQAVAAIFVIGDRTMHELCSLTESPLTSTWKDSIAWRPTEGGRKFRAVPGAPVPAGTRRARLTQMRTIASNFSAATSAPPDYAGGPSYGELRLLPQPLYRDPEETPLALDGALFTFAFGTDPEVLLRVEALNTSEGAVWHYAAAPFTDFAIELKYRDEVVWNEPHFLTRVPETPSLRVTPSWRRTRSRRGIRPRSPGRLRRDRAPSQTPGRPNRRAGRGSRGRR
jgi:hypothetical protein